MRRGFLPICAALARACAALVVCVGVGAAAETMTIPGPQGPLEGELLPAGAPRAAVVIIPGSGPTDRDGNGPAGLRSDSYKLLARALAARGISALRIDKRGMFGSAAAIADADRASIADYADDARSWAQALARRTGLPCVWLAGHSEGGLVALVAASEIAAEAGAGEVCGLILLAAPGRPVGTLMREQLRANPANGPYLPELDRLIGALERSETTEPGSISPVLRPLFRPGLQAYMIQLFAYDPAAVAREVTLPVLIAQGGRDIQVTTADADALSRAMPKARRVDLPEMTHMLKPERPGDPLASYRDPGLPVMPELIGAIVDFIDRPRD